MTNDTELNMPAWFYSASEDLIEKHFGQPDENGGYNIDSGNIQWLLWQGVKTYQDIKADKSPMDVEQNTKLALTYIQGVAITIKDETLTEAADNIESYLSQPDQSEVIRDLAEALKGHVDLYNADGDYLEQTGDGIQNKAYQALEKHAEAIKKAGE